MIYSTGQKDLHSIFLSPQLFDIPRRGWAHVWSYPPHMWRHHLFIHWLLLKWLHYLQNRKKVQKYEKMTFFWNFNQFRSKWSQLAGWTFEWREVVTTSIDVIPAWSLLVLLRQSSLLSERKNLQTETFFLGIKKMQLLKVTHLKFQELTIAVK